MLKALLECALILRAKVYGRVSGSRCCADASFWPHFCSVFASWSASGFLGDLGAGKTTLIQGILRGLGYDDLVSSPSYALLHHYPLSDCVVVHVDCYRLDSKQPDVLLELGLPEYLADPEILCLWSGPIVCLRLLPVWTGNWI